MFRLIRGLVGLLLLVGLAYVTWAVPLGELTLWQHLRAIAGTAESHRLVEGLKQQAEHVWPGGATRGDRSASKPGGGAASAPVDQLSPQERARLRELIRDRLQSPMQASGPPPR